VSQRIERLEVTVYRVPIDRRDHSQGAWNSVTLVAAEAINNGCIGVGYTYACEGAATIIVDKLRQQVVGQSWLSPQRLWRRMAAAVRNVGRHGVAACAISAVDSAIWDLKARALGLPLVDLLGEVHEEGLAIHGSGGSSSGDLDMLQDELVALMERGMRRVKMKVGREPARDRERVLAARRAVGPDVELMVDASGSYGVKQALDMAAMFAEARVCWLEEPVAADDLDGLRFVRERCPPSMVVAGGHEACQLQEHRRILSAGAVDVMQADVTRTMGITGLLRTAALCEAHHTPLSLSGAPALTLHPGAALDVTDAEYFVDHARVEELLFEGVVLPQRGKLRVDRNRTGNGLALRHERVDPHRISSA
jgi:L-alanine-DL-glutamate epimerase-like enolase superfamily enzyme